MRVLIAYDGSDCANVAIDDLKRAGLPTDVEARVISVADIFPHLATDSQEPAGDDAMSQITRNAQAAAKKALAEAKLLAGEGAAKVKRAFPSWKVEPHARGDSPYWGVITEASAWNADLVAIGARGRSAATMFLGSVSQKVITHAPCSVRVARSGGPRLSDDPIRLVLGVDFSIGAATAISAIAARSWPAGTEVILVTALDTQILTALPMLFSSRNDLSAPDEETLIAKLHDEVSRELEQASLRVVSVVKKGRAKGLLLSEADARRADCIFVGSTGLTRMERLLLGSVSSSVASDAPCSVEIVRA